MILKFKKFTTLSKEEKKLFFEAYVTLGLMRSLILTISFKRLTRSLKHKRKKKELEKLSEKEVETAQKIGQAITRASAYTPWESACLAQSLTAQKMLKKRGISGVFYLGARKDKESGKKMQAHAWTQCADSIITGAYEHKTYTVLSVFEW